MDRTVYINIAGKEYPMRFSLGASKKIAENFGSLKKMQDNLTGDASGEGTEAKSLEVIAYMLAVLIKQGCAYKNLFEADQPIPSNAPVKDGKYIGLEQEISMHTSLAGGDIYRTRPQSWCRDFNPHLPRGR